MENLEKKIENKNNEDIVKIKMIEFLTEIADRFLLPENSKIIDEILEKDKAARELSDMMMEYAKKIESGDIKLIAESSARDMIGNLYFVIMRGISKIEKKNQELFYQKFTSENFSLLKEYLNLLKKYKDFEEAESSKYRGFLGDIMGEEELKKMLSECIKKDENIRAKYIEECKKILESKKE